MQIDKRLVQAALHLIESKYPAGWGGASAMYTEKGNILTSISPDGINASTELCFETGAIIEAHKLNEKVTHVVSIIRDDFRRDGHYEYRIVTPCGICQERLFYWGADVQCAINSPSNEVHFKRLDEIQPFHWYNLYRPLANGHTGETL